MIKLDRSGPFAFVIGYASEGVIEHFLSTADDRLEFQFLDLDVLPHDPLFSVSLTSQGLCWNTTSNSWTLTFDIPIYSRFFLREVSDPLVNERLQKAYEMFTAFCDGAPPEALIINRPLSGILNSSKMTHMRELKKLGFSVPNAFVTNLRSALETYGPTAITKGCSGIRSVAKRFTPQDVSALSSRLNVPALLQDFVQGPDVRVHMLGYESVAIMLKTEFDDYRYAVRNGFSLAVSEVDIRPDLIAKCWSYMKSERLEFAGFDFKIDSAGEWWLLEVNPMPGFAFYDKRCNGRIAQLLWNGLRRGYSPIGDYGGLKDFLIDVDRLPVVDRGKL